MSGFLKEILSQSGNESASSITKGGSKSSSGRINKPMVSKGMQPLKIKPTQPIMVWGNHNFHFEFKNQGESMYNTSKCLIQRNKWLTVIHGIPCLQVSYTRKPRVIQVYQCRLSVDGSE